MILLMRRGVSRLQETLRVESCVELELSLKESDLEPSLLTLRYTGGAMMAPPSNFGASQLQHEGLVWSNLHMNLVTWVPTMTKTPKKFQKFMVFELGYKTHNNTR